MEEPVRESKHRLFTFGLDYKITPDNDPAIIEINGCNSGINGFIKLHPEAEKIREGTRYFLNDWLKENDSLFGFNPDEKELMERYEKGPPKTKDWNFRVPTAGNFVEMVTYEKHFSRMMVPDEYCVPGMAWKDNNFDELEAFICELYDGGSRLVDMERYPFIVFKPAFGTAHGDGIRIFYVREKGKIPHKMYKFLEGLGKEEHKTEYLIEGFVPSKLFENPETGKMHDACGRMLIDFHVDLESAYYMPVFSANYLRLAPENWTDEGFTEDMMRANLTGKVPAIPVDAPHEVSEIVTGPALEVADVLLGTSIYFMEKKKIRGL